MNNITEHVPEDKLDHKHVNAICEKEFNRGWAFGEREAYYDFMKRATKAGGAVGKDFQRDEILVRIPREVYTKLQSEVEKYL